MRCKCGGNLKRASTHSQLYTCSKCGKIWDLDFELFPIVEMREVKKIDILRDTRDF